MPVRVRCPQCEKVVNAPDAARGKAVKCPECEARIPVPAGDDAAKSVKPVKSGEKSAEKPASKAKPDAKKAVSAKKKPDEDEDDFLAKLDLNRAEDRRAKVCPKCGHEVDEEDVECPACGIDLQTGGLGKTAKKARMKGPDPADYYGVVWKESAAFVQENFALVINSWIALLALTGISWVMGTGGIFFLLNEHRPSFWFFRAFAWMLSVAMFGWFFLVSVKTVQFALEKKSALDRTPFDSFTSMAMGFSWLIWCVVSALPFAIITGPIYFLVSDNDALRYGLIAGISLAGILPLVPVVMSHRAMPVNGHMWISPLMWQTAARCFGGVMMFLLVGFVTFIPVAGLVAGDVFLGRSLFYPVIEAWGIKHEGWTNEVLMAFTEFFLIVPFGVSSSGAASAVMSGVYVFLWVLVKVLSLFCMTVWGFFMLRASALFTYYNKKKLNLIGEVIQKKYVAKKKGAEGEEGDGMSPTVKWLVGTLCTVIFYVVVNVILYVSGSQYLLMPRPLALLLKLAS